MSVNHTHQVKMRRMKQMEGLLMISRPKVDEFATAEDKMRVVKPKKAHLMLQPQQLQLTYSTHEDQEMNEILGRIDLDGAKLEQAPDGFLIHSHRTHKKFKLLDTDKAAVDAWFYAVYAAITEFERIVIEGYLDEHKYMAALTKSIRDEASDLLEFELSCQLVISAHEPILRWKVWKTSAELEALYESLRSLTSMAKLLAGIAYPRERKRDSFFGGLRKKFVQELRQQQLSLFIDKIFNIPELSSDPDAATIIQDFLRVDTFFDFRAVAEVQNSIKPVDGLVYESQEVHDLTERSNSTNQDEEPYMEPRTCHASTEFHDEEILDVEPVTDSVEAKKLHEAVIRMVRNLVRNDDDRVSEFQYQTKDFGRGRTDAKEYCAFLLGAIGAKDCCSLIPMMARLLPDNEKRLALLTARTGLIRRKQRRFNRRRSKQFSESVALQQFRLAHDELQSHLQDRQKMRPKSDSLAVWSQGKNLGREEPKMSFERRNSLSSCSGSSCNTQNDSLNSKNRNIDRQYSLSELRANNLPSDDLPSTVPSTHSIGKLTSQKYNPWLQGANSLHTTYVRGVTEKARHQNEQGDQVSDITENNPSSSSDNVEENPVLARLRKQGAVNFMLR